MNSSLLRSYRRLLDYVLILAILASVMTTAGVVLDHTAGMPSASTTSSNNVRIWLNGNVGGVYPGWNNTSPGPTITVVSGTTVNLLLNATDNLSHNWFIDSKSNGQPDPNGISSPDFSSSSSPLSFTFTPIIGQNIPAAGNWTYRCRYHPFPYMYGTIRVVQPDFSLSAHPSRLTTTVGTIEASTITVASLFSFTGTVILSVTGSNGLRTTIDPGIIASASGTATLNATATSAGNYTATVIGTSGALTHSLNVTVQAGDFTINVNPAEVSIQVNTPATSAITVIALNHFAGVVDLASNSTYCNLNPARVTRPEGSTLSCAFASSGPHHVLVTGTNDSLSHSNMITFDVTAPKLAGFTISVANTMVTLRQGSHTNDAIEIKSTGISGTVSLTVTISPTSLHHRLAVKLRNSSITLSSNAVDSTVLWLSAHGSKPPSDYIVTLTATSGSLTQSVTITVAVTPWG